MFSNRCYSNGQTSFRPALRLDEIDLPKKGRAQARRRDWSEVSQTRSTKYWFEFLMLQTVLRRGSISLFNMFLHYSKWDRHKGAAHANHDAAYVVTFAWGEDIWQKPPFRPISCNFPASVHFGEQRKRIMRWHMERAHFRKNKQRRNPRRRDWTLELERRKNAWISSVWKWHFAKKELWHQHLMTCDSAPEMGSEMILPY